jgi:hypothetical protein
MVVLRSIVNGSASKHLQATKSLCDILTQDRFEPTSSLCVSGMVCVGGCPTLPVEGEIHQHINPSAKCIPTFGLTLLHVEDESVSEVDASACFT